MDRAGRPTPTSPPLAAALTHCCPKSKASLLTSHHSLAPALIQLQLEREHVLWLTGLTGCRARRPAYPLAGWPCTGALPCFAERGYESCGHSIQKPECPRSTSAGSGHRTLSAAREKGMEGVSVSAGWRRVRSHQPAGQEWGSLFL